MPAFVLLVTAGCFGQSPTGRIVDPNANTWFAYFGDHPLTATSKWGGLTEGHIRRSDGLSLWQQWLFREGISYRVVPSVEIVGGFVYSRTYPYGDFPAVRAYAERRAYEQASYRRIAGKVEVEHRVRLEQRWVESAAGSQPVWRYQNRARYQLKGSIPFGSRQASNRPWYVFGGDELFVPFGPNHGPGLLDQNRLFGGVGYRINSYNRLEVAYLNQLIYQRNGLVEESNHTLRVQFSSAVPLFGGKNRKQ